MLADPPKTISIIIINKRALVVSPARIAMPCDQMNRDMLGLDGHSSNRLAVPRDIAFSFVCYIAYVRKTCSNPYHDHQQQCPPAIQTSLMRTQSATIAVSGHYTGVRHRISHKQKQIALK